MLEEEKKGAYFIRYINKQLTINSNVLKSVRSRNFDGEKLENLCLLFLEAEKVKRDCPFSIYNSEILLYFKK